MIEKPTNGRCTFVLNERRCNSWRTYGCGDRCYHHPREMAEVKAFGSNDVIRTVVVERRR